MIAVQICIFVTCRSRSNKIHKSEEKSVTIGPTEVRQRYLKRKVPMELISTTYKGIDGPYGIDG